MVCHRSYLDPYLGFFFLFFFFFLAPSLPLLVSCHHLLLSLCTVEMSSAASERVCYVDCNFCSTILAVNVPCNNLFNIVTVRCGHCSNLLPVNMGALVQSLPLVQDLQNHSMRSADYAMDCETSSKGNTMPLINSTANNQQRTLPIRPPEKKQRIPSAYNRFIKEEIQRIKANNPDISHREAFSTAAKNWAHFPHIHFGQTS